MHKQLACSCTEPRQLVLLLLLRLRNPKHVCHGSPLIFANLQNMYIYIYKYVYIFANLQNIYIYTYIYIHTHIRIEAARMTCLLVYTRVHYSTVLVQGPSNEPKPWIPHSTAHTADYVIFLQDDIMVAPGLIPKLEAFYAEHNTTVTADAVDVLTLFMSQTNPKSPVRISVPGSVHYGAVGLVVRVSVAREFVAYSRDRFADAPVDWLLNDFVKDSGKALWAFHPNLVEHVGKASSLAGKRQGIVSSSFRDKGCWVQ